MRAMKKLQTELSDVQLENKVLNKELERLRLRLSAAERTINNNASVTNSIVKFLRR